MKTEKGCLAAQTTLRNHYRRCRIKIRKYCLRCQQKAQVARLIKFVTTQVDRLKAEDC